MKLVLFDFDGTLTTKDSFIAFAEFTSGKKKVAGLYYKHLFKVIGYRMGLYDGGKLKEAILTDLYKGKSEVEMIELGQSFYDNEMTKILRSDTLEKFNQHKSNEDEICLVSASLDVWLKPFCDTHNIKLICTEMAFNNGTCTGKLATPNCNHEEKKKRVLEEYQLSNYDEIIAYGDSKGDEFLFELAHKSFKV